MEFNLYFFEGPGKVPQGPVPSFELVGMCSGATGSAEGVTMDTLVWTEGMGDWEEFRVVNELMGLYEMVQPSQPDWTAPPGEHTVPPEFQEWIAALDASARLSVFHTALTKYMPAIMQGQDSARDALLASYISRNPDKSMDSNPNNYNLTTPFLRNILTECEGMPQATFSELLIVGNEVHVASLLTAAAQLDAKFMARVENAYHMGQAIKCVSSGDEAGLQHWLDRRPGLVNARNLDGTCILHQVVTQGKHALLRTLLQRYGAADSMVPINLECLDPEHNTPLHLAATASDTEAAEALLRSGANVNAQNHNASEYANGDWSVRTAGEEATPVVAEHQTALHIAAEQVDPDMLDTLLRHKPDLEAPDADGMTPLHVAIEAADSECVEKLLAAGSKADTSNTVFGEGSTCLHNAAGRGLTGVVKLLLDHQSAGLDVNAPNAEGWTPLHLAARKGNAAICECLIKKGANTGAVNGQGQTAAYLAAVNKRQAVVDLLQSV